MKRVIVTFLFVFHLYATYADVIISGRIVKGDGVKKVYLYKYIGNELSLKDSAVVLSSRFVFQEEQSFQDGQYRLLFNGYQPFELIICDNKNIDITIDVTNILDSSNYNFNNENRAFSKFLTFTNSVKIRGLLLWKAKEEMMKSESINSDKFNKFKDEYQSMVSYVEQEADNINRLYPNTYTANVLVNLLKEGSIDNIVFNGQSLKEIQEIRMRNFFNTWAFNNANIANNPYIAERLQYYFSRICFSDSPSIEKGIDFLMSKVNGAQNSEVKDYILNFLIKHFLRFGPIEASLYIADNLLDGCTAMPVVKENLAHFDKMRKVIVGQKYIDVKGLTPNGREVELSDYIGKKNVLLLFWSSSCSHCLTEIPQIKQIYNSYKQKGFEVVAFSLDGNSDSWLQAISKYQLEWVNLSDFKSFNSANVINYYVYKTPFNILISKDGIIVAKNKWDSELIYELNKIIK